MPPPLIDDMPEVQDSRRSLAWSIAIVDNIRLGIVFMPHIVLLFGIVAVPVNAQYAVAFMFTALALVAVCSFVTIWALTRTAIYLKHSAWLLRYLVLSAASFLVGATVTGIVFR